MSMLLSSEAQQLTTNQCLFCFLGQTYRAPLLPTHPPRLPAGNSLSMLPLESAVNSCSSVLSSM